MAQSCSEEGNETNSSYRATYRRMSACGLTDSTVRRAGKLPKSPDLSAPVW